MFVAVLLVCLKSDGALMGGSYQDARCKTQEIQLTICYMKSNVLNYVSGPISHKTHYMTSQTVLSG